MRGHRKPRIRCLLKPSSRYFATAFAGFIRFAISSAETIFTPEDFSIWLMALVMLSPSAFAVWWESAIMCAGRPPNIKIIEISALLMPILAELAYVSCTGSCDSPNGFGATGSGIIWRSMWLKRVFHARIQIRTLPPAGRQTRQGRQGITSGRHTSASNRRASLGSVPSKAPSSSEASPGADQLPDLPGLPILLRRHVPAKAERAFLGRAARAGRRSA